MDDLASQGRFVSANDTFRVEFFKIQLVWDKRQQKWLPTKLIIIGLVIHASRCNCPVRGTDSAPNSGNEGEVGEALIVTEDVKRAPGAGVSEFIHRLKSKVPGCPVRDRFRVKTGACQGGAGAIWFVTPINVGSIQSALAVCSGCPTEGFVVAERLCQPRIGTNPFQCGWVPRRCHIDFEIHLFRVFPVVNTVHRAVLQCVRLTFGHIKWSRIFCPIAIIELVIDRVNA